MISDLRAAGGQLFLSGAMRTLYRFHTTEHEDEMLPCQTSVVRVTALAPSLHGGVFYFCSASWICFHAAEHRQ